jgi:hypothetical protein
VIIEFHYIFTNFMDFEQIKKILFLSRMSNDDNPEFIILAITSNSISIIATSIMIYFFFKFEKIRTFAFRLVFFLNISGLIWSIANIINVVRKKYERNTFICEL